LNQHNRYVWIVENDDRNQLFDAYCFVEEFVETTILSPVCWCSKIFTHLYPSVNVIWNKKFNAYWKSFHDTYL